MHRRLPALLLAATLIAAACSSDSDDGGSTTTASAGESTAATTAPATAAPSTAPAASEPAATTSTLPTIELDASLQPGVEQLAITGAESGTSLAVAPVADPASPATEGTVDAFGSLLFRGLEGGADYVIVSDDGVTDAVTTLDRTTHPDPEFYAGQQIEPGYGYIETRD
ncbi:MAG: hypothetical protein AAFY28_11825, partial [Actinomycetota bacterium]